MFARGLGSLCLSGGPSPIGPSLSTRGLRKGKAPRKPKIKLRIDLEGISTFASQILFTLVGQVRVPEKIPGYGPEEMDKYVKWLDKTTAKVHARTGGAGGDRWNSHFWWSPRSPLRFNTELQNEIDAYIGIQWGIAQSKIKAAVRLRKCTFFNFVAI